MIDAHLHAFTAEFFALLAREAAAAGHAAPTPAAVAERVGLTLPPADAAAHARQWLRELDRNGVSGALCIASHPGEAEAVAALIACADRRMVGACVIDPRPATAPARVAEVVERLGYRALVLFPTLHRYLVADQEWLLAYANQRNLTVIVQCGVVEVPLRDRFGLPRSADIACGDPLALIAAAQRWRGISFVVPHFGAGLLRECLLLGRSCDNVLVDTAGGNGWMAACGVTLDQVLAQALACFGPRRILFGTDSGTFPRGWRRDVFDGQRAALERLAVPAADQEAIFGGNARGLFGMS